LDGHCDAEAVVGADVAVGIVADVDLDAADPSVELGLSRDRDS
jgi:hypothetical protein